MSLRPLSASGSGGCGALSKIRKKKHNRDGSDDECNGTFSLALRRHQACRQASMPLSEHAAKHAANVFSAVWHSEQASPMALLSVQIAQLPYRVGSVGFNATSIATVHSIDSIPPQLVASTVPIRGLKTRTLLSTLLSTLATVSSSRRLQIKAQLPDPHGTHRPQEPVNG
jgi:hypothetical protein